MSYRINLTGQTFGRLTVVSYGGRNKHGQNVWNCTCMCGASHTVLGFILRRGESKSCGCLQIESRRKMLGEAAYNTLLRNYKRNAEDRGLTWDLTELEFRLLTKGCCNYCGSLPSQTQKPNSKTGGVYLYNGIDRVNSSTGYSKQNCVSCCGPCNKMKWDLTHSEFISQIQKILSHAKESSWLHSRT